MDDLDVLRFHAESYFPLGKKKLGERRFYMYSAIILCDTPEQEPIEGETIELEVQGATRKLNIEVTVHKVIQLVNEGAIENRNFIIYFEKRGKDVTRDSDF